MAARTLIALRINEQALAEIDKFADEAGHNRSVVVRTLLGEALRNQTVRTAAINRLHAMKELA